MYKTDETFKHDLIFSYRHVHKIRIVRASIQFKNRKTDNITVGHQSKYDYYFGSHAEE